MKKIFSLTKLGMVPLIALFGNVNAQSVPFNASLSSGAVKEITVNELTGEDWSGFTHVNAKALKNFSRNFKEADVAEWSVADGIYKAEFNYDAIATDVFYDRKGRWLATIRTYSEDKLPKDIRHRVRTAYYDFTIFSVQEITLREKIAYLVKIEDQESIKTIRVVDDEMDEYLVMEKSR